MDLTTLFPLFDPSAGWGLLALYASVVFALTTYFVRGYTSDKTSFLVARREIGGFAGASSVGAAWAWAPSMFISSQMAYLNGVAGLFWFCLGNFLTLILFSFFVKKLRSMKPDGFTLAGYIREKFGKRVQSIFLIELWMLATCAFALNALAGSKAVMTLTGINYHFVTVALAAIALTYAWRGGLKASVVTEIFKISVLWLGIIFVVPWVWSATGGITAGAVAEGLGGITGMGDGIFHNEFVVGVFMAVGISTTLGHMGAPWGDNGFYQRAFAIKPNSIIPAFIGGACLFIFVPIMIGTLGFAAAGSGLEIPKSMVGMTTIISVASVLPSWTVLILVFMLLAGLIAVLDSHLNSASALVSNDVQARINDKTTNESDIKWGRWGMVALAIGALAIANYPGITMLTIFLFFGVMRATVWWPVMLHIWKPNLINEKGMFWGIVVAFVVGFPTFFYGKVMGGGAELTMLGTCLTIFGSAALSVIISKATKTDDAQVVAAE